MKTAGLLENLEFHDDHPYAQPLFVSETGRVLRFQLKAGQRIDEHMVPGSPFFVVVLQGAGLFAGSDGNEQQLGPGSLLIFEPGEVHSVQALATDLVFVGFLHSVSSQRPGHVSGEMAR